MTHEDFSQALTRVYLQQPCQVLPGPLWKALAELKDYQTALTTDEHGVSRLEAWSDDSLYIYWRRDYRQPSLSISRRLEYQHKAVVHQDFLDAPTVAGFKQYKSYYRLVHRDYQDDMLPLPAGFDFAGVVHSPDEAQAVAASLEQMGGDSLATVQQWFASESFAPDLWLWVIDKTTDQPAGIAVAELDLRIREAQLVWIQVFPIYQGRGLGKSAVRELLRRIGGRALFTTVLGEVDDRNNPGAFFRSCGFTGNDVWWFLSR